MASRNITFITWNKIQNLKLMEFQQVAISNFNFISKFNLEIFYCHFIKNRIIFYNFIKMFYIQKRYWF